MTKMPMIVSFYTPQYEGHVKDWQQSMADNGLSCVAARIGHGGSWRLNCGMKPHLLKDWLDEYGAVAWADIDARARAYPTKFIEYVEEGIDFAAYFIPNNLMRKGDIPLGDKSGNDGISSGTMFINDTPRARALLDAWINHDTGQHYAEQFVLGEAWHLYHQQLGLKTARMPQGYYKVFDQGWREDDRTVVFEHLQASRELRRVVNQKVGARPRGARR